MGESEDESLDLQIKIAEIDAEFKAMLNAISSDTVEAFDEQRAKELMDAKSQLQQQLAGIAERKQKRENTKSRLDEIFTILDGLRNRPMDYDDRLVRQILECVVVESKERIKVVFIGGLEITETLCEKKPQVVIEQQDETHSSSNPYKNDEKYLFCRPYTKKQPFYEGCFFGLEGKAVPRIIGGSRDERERTTPTFPFSWRARKLWL